MKYYLIANAGIYLEFAKTTLLIDALFDEDFKYFSKPKKDIPYADYVLFTHKHNDHYSETLLNKYLKDNSNSNYLTTDLTTNELSIKFIKSKHIGLKKENNDLIFIDDNKTKIIITGDSDDNYSFYESNNITSDIIFVNPSFLASKNGISILSNIVKPKLVVIYHLPSIDDDVDMHYQTIANNCIKKLDIVNLKYLMLNNPYKTYEFK